VGAMRPPTAEGTRVAASSKTISEIGQELFDLLKAYAKQETVDPLRSLGRYLGFGLGGASLLSLGVFFLAMSALRAMQTQTSVFEGFWSWVPYLIVVIGLAVVIGVSVKTVSRVTKSGLVSGSGSTSGSKVTGSDDTASEEDAA